MNEKKVFKDQAVKLRKRAEELRHPLTYLHSLELVAATYGFPTWNTLLTEIKRFDDARGINARPVTRLLLLC